MVLSVSQPCIALELLHAPSRSPLTAKPAKILVCNQAHIGDVILSSSALPVRRIVDESKINQGLILSQLNKSKRARDLRDYEFKGMTLGV